MSHLQRFSRALVAVVGSLVLCGAGTGQCGSSAPPLAPYEVTLRAPEGGLYAGEEMQLEFRLAVKPEAGATGAPIPVRYARIQCSIDMPSMPGMPAFTEQAHAEGVLGEYGVHPTFQHGGDYRLRLRVLPPNEQPPTMTPRPTQGYEVELPLSVADQPPPDRARSASAVKRYKLALDTTPKPPRAGEPAELRIAMWRNLQRAETLPDGSVRVVGAGEPVSQFDLSHERLLHLFVLRDDLGSFAHEHPQLGEGGTFTLPFTFPSGGAYVVFADAAPRGAGSQVVATRLLVEGPPATRFDLVGAAKGDRGMRQSRGGVTVAWTLPSDPLPVGRTVRIRALVTDAQGQPVGDLQPYLGALGHLMMVGEGGGSFVHAHPDDGASTPSAGAIEFMVRLPDPGLYRGWAQLQRAGEVVTFDFVVRGAEGAG